MEYEKCGILKDIVTTTSDSTVISPPLGIIPKFIWQSKRLSELNDAIARYYNANREISVEWIIERNELIRNK